MNDARPLPRPGPQGATGTCPRCARPFACGARAGLARCWCMDLPPLPVTDPAHGCYCPDCLRELATAGATSAPPA
ncbi:MAG: cysteine-rich CWC family protein [Betaproteobacteria bacterium]|nr:cysteine-rich CWC family protein [Betaproteobacteria bacterium]